MEYKASPEGQFISAFRNISPYCIVYYLFVCVACVCIVWCDLHVNVLVLSIFTSHVSFHLLGGGHGMCSLSLVLSHHCLIRHDIIHVVHPPTCFSALPPASGDCRSYKVLHGTVTKAPHRNSFRPELSCTSRPATSGLIISWVL